MPRPRAGTLAGGVACLVLGLVVLLDDAGTLHLSLGALAAIVTAAAGLVLLAGGLRDEG
jgi:hypothetical protein